MSLADQRHVAGLQRAAAVLACGRAQLIHLLTGVCKLG